AVGDDQRGGARRVRAAAPPGRHERPLPGRGAGGGQPGGVGGAGLEVVPVDLAEAAGAGRPALRAGVVPSRVPAGARGGVPIRGGRGGGGRGPRHGAAAHVAVVGRPGRVPVRADRHGTQPPSASSPCRVRTVRTERVSSDISSALDTFRFSRTVPVAGSTSTIFSRRPEICSLPTSRASATARPSRAVAVSS